MKYVSSNLLVVPFVLTLISCQKGLNNFNIPDASGVSAAVTSAYPSVVKIILPSGGICSGTFISAKAVLTASHCTNTAGTYVVMSSFGTFRTSVFRRFGNGSISDINDIALLIFDQDVANPRLGQVSSLYDKVNEGDLVRIVGFGCTNIRTKTGSGVKRTATNRIFFRDEYLNLGTPLGRGIIGDSSQGGACFGDSGGPMAIEGFDSSLKLVGASHAGGDQGSYSLSQYTDLTRSDNRGFLAQMNTEYQLEIKGI